MAEISTITIISFIVTTIATLGFFYKAIHYKKTIIGILIWMIIVGILGFTGFYRVTDTIPPRFIFLIGPGFLFILIGLILKKKKLFNENLKWFTILHTVRIPVEIILHTIFLNGLIPELMTYKGVNFDILSGISAPMIYYVVFIKKWMGYKGLLLWNIICLTLLVNIVTIAILSAETPFQKLAFNQPNIGVAYFPFVWLPAVIVPIVMYSHIASIIQLLKEKTL